MLLLRLKELFLEKQNPFWEGVGYGSLEIITRVPYTTSSQKKEELHDAHGDEIRCSYADRTTIA